MEDFYILGVLVLAAVLGFVPASIASKKGYSFALWWLYGFLIFIAAVIHAAVLEDKTAQPSQLVKQAVPTQVINNGQSSADELRKFKELLDMGAITEEEFQQKKIDLLKKI